MSLSRFFFGLFVAAVLVIVVAVPLTMRSSAPAEAGLVERLVAPGPVSPAHQSFAGQCATCHTPYKGVEAKTCLSCHAGTDFGHKQSTQFHAKATQCTACHVEHQGNPGITRMNHEALIDPTVWRQPLGATPALSKGRSAEATLNCASCHSFRDPHLGLFGTDCASCHKTDIWTITNYRHPSVNSTECSECHKAPRSHFMEHFSMVSQRAAGEKARVEQCYACHTTDSFNNIRRRGWYDHH